ncbi:hypothetical protein AQUCO_05000001v1 [Aquilegia coerulea]|uniref:WRC domain-containing protein n=1 Tax=Aquilegia coerulea TaxID=218851 RepID=A0A2G5CJ86_AQUCA|nr:hypothetical protein AQUCO_05000001v1 [Aquilegia coerulea]
MSEEDDAIIPPDQFRCIRSDGKQWRCKEWQYQDSKYCENHHIQIIYKKKVNNPKKNKAQLLQVKKKKKVQLEEEDEEQEKFVRKRTRNENANKINSLAEVEKVEKKFNVQKQENEEAKIAKAINLQIQEEEEIEEEEEEKFVRKRRKVEKKINESNENINSMLGAAELSLVEATKLIPVVKEIQECTAPELVFALKTAFRYEDFAKVEHIVKMREEKIIMEKKDAEEQASRFKQLLEVSEIKCAQLSNKLHEKKKEITVVEGKLKESELRKLGIECELLQYKRMCEELQCVKSRAEDEIDGLKKRVNELETQAWLQSCVSRKEYTEEKKKSGSKDGRIQSENINSLKGACLSHVKVIEALDCDGRVYSSANIDSICHSSSRDCRVAKHAGSSENQHNPVPTVSTGGGNLKESLIPSKRGLVCIQQVDDIRSGAQLNHFKICGTSCKESESSSAENGKGKAENFGSTRMDKSLDTVKNESNGSSKATNSSGPEYAEDGITKFLSALRRSKTITWNRKK